MTVFRRETQPDVTREVILAALDSAVRAPSTHNSQPWVFGIDDDPPAVTLFADATRGLPIADPSGRELYISCGTFLHHLRVALAARGRSHRVERLPDPRDERFIARVSVGPDTPTTAEQQALEDAIQLRHTDTGQFHGAPLDDETLETLKRAVAQEGAQLVVLTDSSARARLADLVAIADRAQHEDPLFREELAQWLHWSGSPRRDGISVDGALGLVLPWIVRTFDRGDGEAARDRQLILDGSPTLAIVTTAGDTRMDWLRAGEALSSLLLHAAERNVSSSYLAQVVEVEATRCELAPLSDGGHPQVVLRLGTGRGGSRSARRPLQEMLRDER